jgi:hypothetical protein
VPAQTVNKPYQLTFTLFKVDSRSFGYTVERLLIHPKAAVLDLLISKLMKSES